MKSLIPTRIAFAFLLLTGVMSSLSISAQDACPLVLDDPTYGLFFEHYYGNTQTNNDNWLEDPVLNNNISLTNNELTVNDVYGAQTHRVYRNANTFDTNDEGQLIAYSKKLRVEFKVRVLGGECPNHLIFGLSSGQGDFTIGGTASENRAMGVLLMTSGSDEGFSSCTNQGGGVYVANDQCNQITDTDNPWRFRLMTRAGNGATMFDEHMDEPDHISVPALNTDYYVRLIRSGSDVCLSVCTDAAFTQHVQGSPDCFTNVFVNATPEDEDEDVYRFIQHGGRRASTTCRHATYTIDNLKMFQLHYDYDNGFNCNLRKSDEQHPASLTLYPNPTTGQLMINGLTEADNIERIRIFDVNGSLCKTVQAVTSSSIDMSAFENGLYIIEITTHEKNYQTKIVLDK
jgi:hypothetical protein